MHLSSLLVDEGQSAIRSRAAKVQRCPSVAVGWVARFTRVTVSTEIKGEQHFVTRDSVLDISPDLNDYTGA